MGNRPSSKRLFVATHNAHKVREIGQLLPGWEIVPDDPEGVEENAPDFAGNALIKVRAIAARHRGEWCMADDSGLEVAALGGEISVPTPEGEAQLRIPEGTANGKVFRLRGKGVPSLRGGAAGDLDVRVVIEVPARLDRKQRAALQEFQKLASPDIFPEAQRFANKAKVFFAHRDKLKK